MYKSETTLLGILGERKTIMTDILKSLEKFSALEKFPLESDLNAHELLLKHIASCENPNKLINPEKIKVNLPNTQADSEIEIVKEVDNCPLSQAPIKNIYVAACGHKFEKQELVAFIGNQLSKQCPVVGCHSLIERRDF